MTLVTLSLRLFIYMVRVTRYTGNGVDGIRVSEWLSHERKAAMRLACTILYLRIAGIYSPAHQNGSRPISPAGGRECHAEMTHFCVVPVSIADLGNI